MRSGRPPSHQTAASSALSGWLQRLGPSETQILVACGLAVGIGAGLGAVVFRYLIEAFTYFFFDDAAPRAGNGARPGRGHPPPGPGWPALRPLDLFLCPRGQGTRRPRSHVGGGVARRAHSAGSCRRQVARLGGVHRLGRLGRSGGPDRPDRLGDRLDARPAPPACRTTACVRSSPVARRAASRPPSTHRSQACSSPWRSSWASSLRALSGSWSSPA